MMKELVIGTRASKLALWQAEHVRTLIESQFPIKVQLKKISTKGDRIQDRSLMEIGGKGLFLKEIEDELLAGTVQIAVHSMKDVPYQMPEGLVLGAILPREDSSDAMVSVNFKSLKEMPKGSVVGTSSLRRLMQLQKQYPDLEFKNLRGNVDTRLKKLDEGEFDAIILASAGLIRLGWQDRITEKLDIISSVGQGAIGIEYAEGNSELQELLSHFNDEATSKAVHLERYFSEKLQGTCQTPLGCRVTQISENEQDCRIQCFYATSDGQEYWVAETTGPWEQGPSLVDQLLVSKSQ